MQTLKKRINILSDLLENINLEDIQKIYDFLSVCFEFWRGDEVPIIKEGVSDTLDEINNNPEKKTSRESYQQLKKYQNVDDIPKVKKELDDFKYLYHRNEKRR